MADVLFLCTGNLCRSPSAAWFLTKELEKAGLSEITVDSAGTTGTSSSLPPGLAEEAAVFGLDLSEHVPRKMVNADVSGAAIAIGMTREHLREIVLADPPSFPRSFTLREIVRRGVDIGPRQAGQDLSEWLANLHSGRRTSELLGVSPQDDIPDPMGGSNADYRAMLEEVSALTRSLRSLAWG
jgi:protein-tyrosine phosphatase